MSVQFHSCVPGAVPFMCVGAVSFMCVRGSFIHVFYEQFHSYVSVQFHSCVGAVSVCLYV